MIGLVIAIAAIVSCPGMFYIDSAEFSRAHARRRTYLLDAARHGAVLAAVLTVVGPLGFHRSVASFALAIAAAVLMLLPTRWVRRIGGVEPKWELRRLERDVAILESNYPLQKTTEGVATMKSLMSRIEGLRKAETNELCDLLLGRCHEWIEGNYSPLRLGLRSVRFHELEQVLYGDAARRPEFDAAEATFRWHLYRDFGRMMDYGLAEQSADERAVFVALTDELDDYRRPDTGMFIDAVQESARGWLASHPAELPWPPPGGIADLDPTIVDGYSELWPRTSVFWGATLDDDDRAALLGPAAEAI
jgi:hypothetical protein